MRNRSGSSIVEVIIACAIAATIVAIIWLAIGPSAKRSTIETSIRNDLRQLSSALAIYMRDYDDAYPLGMSALEKHVPGASRKPTAVKQYFPECGSGNPQYVFERNIDILRGEHRYEAEFAFDPAVNAVFKAPFYCRKPGGTKTFFAYGNGRWQPIQKELHLVLGARLDGSIDWFDSWEQYQEEFAAKAHRR